MRRVSRAVALTFILLGIAALPSHIVSGTPTSLDFVHFESSHVHPGVMTPDGSRLLVVNTPDNRLSVFDLTGPKPRRIAEVPVGLEPVSVAARSNAEAWVVNHLSDNISIVDLTTFHVLATLRVGDEPSDVVFAGAPHRAYVSVSQEDAVKVYDPADLGAAPVVIPIPGRKPRALARNADASEVLVNVFHSGGRSTTLSAAEAGDSLPAPNPPMAAGLPPRPRTGLIVKFNGTDWIDSGGHLWNSKIPYSVPPVEVVYLSTATKTVIGSQGDIATTMMGLATSPLTGAAAVTGVRALLDTSFEPNLSGRFTEQRLAILSNPTSPPIQVQLNPHIDYGVLPAPRTERDSALGNPTGVCWSADGQRIYVSSLATDKLGVLSATGDLVARVPTVEGPTGVIADPARPRLYVVGRFRNLLQTLSTADFAELAVTGIGFDPTPDPIVNGRKFFYGGFTSGHGDQACASCHLFGDTDHLAWDLGNPTGAMQPVPPNQIDPRLQPFHPMKGPMVTQSLRGLVGTGVLHWRGDRANLAAFNPAFVGLMGLPAQLPDSEMAAFGDFVLPLSYPPNPYQNLDRTLPDAPPGQPSAHRGRSFFLATPVDGSAKCIDCHALPTGTTGELINRFLLRSPQDMKIPHLRNLYQKTGFKDSSGVVTKRGFGLLHDGSVDNLSSFLKSSRFLFGGTESVAEANRRDVERFLMCFDTGIAPAVGIQLTFDGSNNGDPAASARMDTLEAQADGGNCDLIAKGRIGEVPRGFLYAGGGAWKSDREGEAPLTRDELLALAYAAHAMTVTGVPPGSGHRMGVERDRDGYLDGDEWLAGTDPGDPASNPSNPLAAPVVGAEGLRLARPNPFRTTTSIDFTLTQAGPVSASVYDLMGREVRTLARGQLMAAGPQTLTWDGRSTSGGMAGAGVYFVRLVTGAGRWQRMVIRIP